MPTEILMPALSPTMEEGTLARWLVKEGDSVTSGDIIAEIETDKATMEFEALDEGTLGRILVPEGSAGIAVNTPIAVLLKTGEEEPEIAPGTRTRAAAAEPPADTAPAKPGEGKRIVASPLARRIAAGKGVDLAGITGTGPRGRIVKADVETACARPARKRPGPDRAAEVPAPASAGKHAPVTAGFGGDAIAAIHADRDHTEIALDGMRRTLAARLTEAKQTVPHFYLRRDVRLDALLSLRSDLNAALAPRGVKLSVNDFILKACALAQQRVPAANAVWAEDRILQMAASDLAVAVAVEGGLLTPVLRDAQAKSLSALSTEMKDLASRARNRTLAPQECQGGSFAVSNLGMFGIESFDAIVTPAPWRHPRRRRGGAQAGGSRGRHARHRHDHDAHALGRPSRYRRRAWGDASGGDPGQHRDADRDVGLTPPVPRRTCMRTLSGGGHRRPAAACARAGRQTAWRRQGGVLDDHDPCRQVQLIGQRGARRSGHRRELRGHVHRHRDGRGWAHHAHRPPGGLDRRGRAPDCRTRGGRPVLPDIAGRFRCRFPIQGTMPNAGDPCLQPRAAPVHRVTRSRSCLPHP